MIGHHNLKIIPANHPIMSHINEMNHIYIVTYGSNIKY